MRPENKGGLVFGTHRIFGTVSVRGGSMFLSDCALFLMILTLWRRLVRGGHGHPYGKCRIK